MARGSVNQPANAITTAQIELRVLNSRKVTDIQCTTETIMIYYIHLYHCIHVYAVRRTISRRFDRLHLTANNRMIIGTNDCNCIEYLIRVWSFLIFQINKGTHVRINEVRILNTILYVVE